MAAIYIREQGVMLTKIGERLCAVKGRKTLLDRPVFGIDSIALFGNVQVSAQALTMLMEHGVTVSYFSYGGNYLGQTGADSSKNIFLRMQQYDCYMDPIKRNELAAIIVSNKIRNQLTVIEKWNWKDNFDWRPDYYEIEKNLHKVHDKNGQLEFMGIEGICSNIYFHSFGHMFSCDFEFEKRSRRPPKNPINVILSLGYTLLTKEVASVLEVESFETYMGFLHGIRYGRKSLALDIVEEFRQPVVDRLTLKLFNKGLIGKYDFEFPEEGTVILTEEGFKKYCRAYERWLTGADSAAGDKNFRGRIREQAAHLKDAIRKNEIYRPYSWKDHYVCDQL